MILIANSEGTPGVQTTVGLLRDGAGGLDAIEAGIRAVESDLSIRSVGRNSWPNLVGELELDAAVMDGVRLRTGAVGALKGFAHPISIARAVMDRLPHELLVGEGAARFAAEIGAERAENVTADARAAWRQMLTQHAEPEVLENLDSAPLADLSMRAADPVIGRDTTVFLTLDAADEHMVGVSTSGWAWKYPGRLGDSPLIGAGCYADTEYGAAACVGTGEMAIRAGTARAVVLYLKTGRSVVEAVSEAADDLRRLQGGLIFSLQIHAIGRAGEYEVAVAYPPSFDEMPEIIEKARKDRWGCYWHWQSGMQAPELRHARRIPL